MTPQIPPKRTRHSTRRRRRLLLQQQQCCCCLLLLLLPSAPGAAEAGQLLVTSAHLENTPHSDGGVAATAALSNNDPLQPLQQTGGTRWHQMTLQYEQSAAGIGAAAAAAAAAALAGVISMNAGHSWPVNVQQAATSIGDDKTAAAGAAAAGGGGCQQ